MGRAVVGVESDFSYKKLETTSSQSTGPIPFPSIIGSLPRTETFNGSIEQTWDASLRLRAGHLITPGTLAYVTGGLAVGEISGTSNYLGQLRRVTALGVVFFQNAVVNASWRDPRVGATVGAGLEQIMGPGLKARIEYRYTDFGKYSKTAQVGTTCDPGVGICTAPTTSNIDVQAAFHKLTAGIGFDF